jgi:nicotinamide N-methyltransferase/methyltransferase
MVFGCGPTIHVNISASAKFRNIICAEYTEENRSEVEKWILNDKDVFDWSQYFKYVTLLEGKRYVNPQNIVPSGRGKS